MDDLRLGKCTVLVELTVGCTDKVDYIGPGTFGDMTEIYAYFTQLPCEYSYELDEDMVETVSHMEFPNLFPLQ